MAALTAGAAWPSYLHGLFIVREVGNTGNVAYDLPLLPDGLIGVSTVALIQAAQRKALRPSWATIGLVLGIVLTMAQNVASGYPHGPGAMLVNGLVPVLLIIALEILVWSSQLGRAEQPSRRVSAAVAPDAESAARAAMEATHAAGNPLSINQLQERFSLSRGAATKLRREVTAPVSLNGQVTADAS